MSTKHTPAPWTTGKQASLVVFANRICIASCGGYQDNTRDCEELHAEQVANARLISAAPELLEACQEFVRKVDAGEARSTRSHAQMKAAIDKALGEQA